MLLDLNSFFASCEQQENPHLRGKPIAVVPTLSDSTSVIAASYQAKKFGIKTNTSVRDAKKMCPNIILVPGNHRLYTSYHHRIIEACHEILPVKKVLSIDEMAFELIGSEREENQAIAIAQKMKDHVRAKVGSEITSSVGIGPNILIAKIASDMQKPDGLVSVTQRQILEKLGPLPVEAISGVGKQIKAKLNLNGYFKIRDLLETPEQLLRKQWGTIWGLRISRELRGQDFSNVSAPEAQQKSISHQHVLAPDLRNPEAAFQVLLKLLMKALTRLRRERMKSGELHISVKFVNDTKFESGIRFNPTDEMKLFVQETKKLYKPLLGSRRYPKPIKVTVTLNNLSQGASQMSFFDDPKSVQINEALDRINDKFGANTLFLAGASGASDAAKTRISFHHIPDLRDEFDGDK